MPSLCCYCHHCQVEDRTAVRERVETIVEHRPVEKEYLTEVRWGKQAVISIKQ
jgi:hypothetical protein